LSDILSWKENNHPIARILYQNLNILDEYPVENFHSLIRRSTSSKITTPEALRRYAINIDYEKHENHFIQNFAHEKKYPFTKQKLDMLTIKSAIFLLNFFTDLYRLKNNFKIQNDKKNEKKSTNSNFNSKFNNLNLKFNSNVNSNKKLNKKKS